MVGCGSLIGLGGLPKICYEMLLSVIFLLLHGTCLSECVGVLFDF
jgi:hypothetical protein